jgi:hypothetical protein
VFARLFSAAATAGRLSALFIVTPFTVAMPAAPAAPIGQTQPATAEARSCAAAGEEILAGNAVRAAVYQEQFSHYSPRTSRCYVEMRVETMPAGDDQPDRFGRFLYDGQTKELLAFAEIKDGKKSGRVFDLNHRTTTFANSGWDDANEYIYRMMAGDR